MAGAPTLTTERLVLRPHVRADLDDYIALWNEPEVQRYTSGKSVLGREEGWTRFLRQSGMWAMMGFGFFVVEDRATGAFLGEAGFQERLREIEPAIEGTLECGWALTPAAHGRGIATEAMAAALAWAGAAFPDASYSALIDARNAASMRVAEKLGFALWAETEYHGVAAKVFARAAA